MKFRIKYDSPPSSEVVKECVIKALGRDGLTLEEAVRAVNKFNSVLGRPLIGAEDINSVEAF